MPDRLYCDDPVGVVDDRTEGLYDSRGRLLGKAREVTLGRPRNDEEETVRGLLPRERDAAGRLFAGLRIAPLGEAEGWQAGEWRCEYAARGRTLAQADCLVAAAAFSIGGRLATGNPKDFPMAELAVEDRPAGA